MPMKPLTHYERNRNAINSDSIYKRSTVNNVARAIRASTRWTHVSTRHRKKYPLCADPFGHHATDGIVVPVDDVHHVKPLEEHPELAFTESNLMSVCRACHTKLDGKKHYHEAPGG